MTGDVHKKIHVARIFKENFEIFEQNKAKIKWRWEIGIITQRVPGDRY